MSRPGKRYYAVKRQPEESDYLFTISCWNAWCADNKGDLPDARAECIRWHGVGLIRVHPEYWYEHGMDELYAICVKDA